MRITWSRMRPPWREFPTSLRTSKRRALMCAGITTFNALTQ